MAPRMISHMTSSIPSEPASRTYSMCGIQRQAVRVGDQPVEERVVERRLMKPARGPCSWWLMPPVPQTWT